MQGTHLPPPSDPSWNLHPGLLEGYFISEPKAWFALVESAHEQRAQIEKLQVLAAIEGLGLLAALVAIAVLFGRSRSRG